MTTIGEQAKEYEPQRMKNIVDLEVVSVKQEFKKETRKDRDGEEYTVSFIVVEGVEYRVPISILEQLQTLIAEKPLMETFKVIKKGEGKATKYTVIPL